MPMTRRVLLVLLACVVFAGAALVLWSPFPDDSERSPRETPPESNRKRSESPETARRRRPQSSPNANRAVPLGSGFESVPPEHRPDAVEALAAEARRRCHGPDVQVVVDCGSYPCIVMTLAYEGVREPFCSAMSDAPRFPHGVARSPIDLQSRRFTFAHPILDEVLLEDEEVREQVRIRTERMALDWFATD